MSTTPRESRGAPEAAEETGGQLDAAIQNRLGTMLKQHYDDLVSAPIPDQFLVLLAELEAKEKAGGR